VSRIRKSANNLLTGSEWITTHPGWVFLNRSSRSRQLRDVHLDLKADLLAEKGRLPAIFPYRDSCKLGGLMGYGGDGVEIVWQQANQIAQIPGGTSPGEIPIYQPTKFFLVINLKTAKALGITFPPAILARADELIE